MREQGKHQTTPARSRSPSSRLTAALGFLLTPLPASCEDAPSALDPSGPGAETIAGLWWLMLILATIVALVTFTFLGIALWRSRQGRPVEKPLGLDGQHFVILAGAIVPTAILLFLTVSTLDVMADLDEPPEPPSHVIEITGWMWWWEVVYPDAGVVTANEIHIPAGQTVELRLTSADVIHSFWVPEISGKIDLMPGSENTFWIKADEPGIYRGQCAEFCGVQHALMAKLLIVQEPEEYQAWLEHMAQPAPTPTEPVQQHGLDVFMQSQCRFCHTIRGTDARGDVGPELTHLMSRQTLGAVTIRNSTGNLAAWVADPHQFKPGVKMPAFVDDIVGEDFQALIAYLASLE
ncbi:MAG TPA: cytochrome c oxidase subunit II [Thermomicrobiales bacterium]|nr:cytochrome c oxidase subunit II [Thermomicrobiales bacterium]